jgi:hypothetical protein
VESSLSGQIWRTDNGGRLSLQPSLSAFLLSRAPAQFLSFGPALDTTHKTLSRGAVKNLSSQVESFSRVQSCLKAGLPLRATETAWHNLSQAARSNGKDSLQDSKAWLIRHFETISLFVRKRGELKHSLYYISLAI